MAEDDGHIHVKKYVQYAKNVNLELEGGEDHIRIRSRHVVLMSYDIIVHITA